MFFFIFCQGKLRRQPKFLILLILTGKNASKWLEWCVFRVWGMPNPMPQVSSLCNKWFLKIHNFRQKFHILLKMTGFKMHEHCLNGMYASVLLGIPFYPWHHVSEPYTVRPSSKKCRILGDHNNSTSTGLTQSSNIVHCNWHTQQTYIWVRFANLFDTIFQSPVQIWDLSVILKWGEFRK